ncbi:MAG: hypothetical protein FJ096_16540 [Deltaproteobacteria bacterium]|nr:hypothetical protein [Deltaproteobacteria bacterium]
MTSDELARDAEDPAHPPNRPTHGPSLPPRPLLASEALRDDLAPVEPLAKPARIVAAAGGVILAGTAWSPAWEPAGKPWVELASAACALAIGTLPVGYQARAGALLTVGMLVALVGIAGSGPASVVAYALGEWGVLALLAAVVLPATLLFRCHYRAYRAARAMLAAALALCVPFAVVTAAGFQSADVSVQVTSALGLVGTGFGLLGFTGSQTPLSGGALASIVNAAIVAPIVAGAGLRFGYGGATAWYALSLSSLSFGVATGLASLGAFQLLAAHHWKRARDQEEPPLPADPPAPAPSAPSLTDTWHDRR